MEELLIDELDTAGVLAEVGRALYERRAAEVHDLRLLSHWAALHGTDPRQEPDASPFDHLVPVGGDGTPWVQDMCLAEIAVVRRVHERSLRSALADVLDLQHRLPRVWDLVERLEAEPWVARRAAAMSRPVALEHMGVVDAAVAQVIAGEAPSRVLELVAAKVIEAEPEAHARRVEEQRRRRFVGLGRADESGLRHLIARVTAGDAVTLEAMVDRVARILADRYAAAAEGDLAQVPGMQELRSEALGMLGRPAESLQVLLAHGLEQTADPGADTRTDLDRGDPLQESRSTALPADILAALRAIDPAELRPQLTIYAHVSADALGDPERGVARVEGMGPVLISQLRAILGECAVTLAPVIDLAEAVRGTAYEHRAPLKERVWLLVGRDAFPYSSHCSRNVDFDHVRPYCPGGEEGQTGTHNSQPLGRRSHRRKTHAGFRTTQLSPGRYVWRTPHGHYLMVGPHGTYPISPEQGRAVENPVPVQIVYSLPPS